MVLPSTCHLQLTINSYRTLHILPNKQYMAILALSSSLSHLMIPYLSKLLYSNLTTNLQLILLPYLMVTYLINLKKPSHILYQLIFVTLVLLLFPHFLALCLLTTLFVKSTPALWLRQLSSNARMAEDFSTIQSMLIVCHTYTILLICWMNLRCKQKRLTP